MKKTLSRAKKAMEDGNTAVAIELYNVILQHQPHNRAAKKGVYKLQKKLLQNRSIQIQTTSPSLDTTNALITLYHSGQIKEAEQACKALLQTHPQSLLVYNILGATLQGQGKLSEAVQTFNKAIAIKPDHAQAYNNLGLAFQELGQLEKAMRSYNKAIEFKPDYVQAYNNRGNTYKALGELRKAVESYNKAIEFKPDYAKAYSNRGSAFQELGQLKKAVANYNKAIELKPDFAEAFSNRGFAFQELGQFEGALENYTKAIELKPDFAEAYNNRGNVYKALGQLEKAVESCTKAIEFKPDFAEAFSNRGNALKELDLLEEAVASYTKAIEVNPNFAEAYNNCGNAFQELKQLEKAMAGYNKAIELKPDFAEAHSNRGLLFQELGQFEEAITSNNRAIEIKPNYAEAYRNLSILKKYESNDAQIRVMENLFTNSQHNESDHMHLCFALAKVYEDIGENHKSFELLKKGNHLRKKELKYNINNDRLMIDKIMDFFKTGGLAIDIVPKSYSSILPVFIVGMPRSGTSLVEQILATHSKVHGAGELKAMNKIVSQIVLPSLPGKNVTQGGANLSQHTIKNIRNEYLATLAALKVPEKIITDKMPLNFKFIGFILSAFPEAKIINLIRDPRATCWSIYKHYFASKGNGYAYEIGDLAEFYKLYTDLMSFWRKWFPDNIYDLCYEDLTEKQEKETRRLLSFCDLEWEKQCLSFHKTKRAVNTASAAQVRKKLYKGSSEKWRNYEEQLLPLINALGY